MKITKKKCPGCGRKVQYIKHGDGSGWFQEHKNRQGERCDEKPGSGSGFLKLLSFFGIHKIHQ